MTEGWSNHFGQGGTWRCAAALALLMAGTLLAACSANLAELPSSAEQPPPPRYSFPGVHDMPPSRSNTTLSDTERQQAQQDLINVRNAVTHRAQQKARRAASETAAKKPVKPDRSTAQATGSDRSP